MTRWARPPRFIAGGSGRRARLVVTERGRQLGKVILAIEIQDEAP